jgi:hypothetical protein
VVGKFGDGVADDSEHEALLIQASLFDDQGLRIRRLVVGLLCFSIHGLSAQEVIKPDPGPTIRVSGRELRRSASRGQHLAALANDPNGKPVVCFNPYLEPGPRRRLIQLHVLPCACYGPWRPLSVDLSSQRLDRPQRSALRAPDEDGFRPGGSELGALRPGFLVAPGRTASNYSVFERSGFRFA